MKARIPKSWLTLPKKEKEAIARLIEQESADMMDKQEIRLVVQFMKVACIVLHTYFGFGAQRLLTFIGDFKIVRRKFKNANTSAEFEAMLDAEMEKIFKDGFPTAFVEDLQKGK